MRSSRSPSASSFPGSRRPAIRRAITIAVAALAALLVVVSVALAGGGQKVTLTLDWTPNPDHVGFYDAQQTGLFARAGLDVSIRAPSDPTAPLKLVGVGRSDLAVSYEQELFFAAAKNLPVVAVAAVVPQPLNSFMAIEPGLTSLRDLRGKTVGITGVPSDYAALDTALQSVGLTRKDVKVVSVGYNLLPSLLAHRVDVVLGVYRNVEGIQLQLRDLHPTIIPVDRAGVPTYDELVLVASKTRLHDDPTYRSEVKRFVRAFLAGTADARAHPRRALVILSKVTASGAKFLARATPATLRLLAGPRGTGCLSVRAWQRFAAWMHARGLLKHPIPASAVVDASFLPSRCR
jgi:putative hydroxymethylpyrimidine transport system substrate-binding protein